jgi:hypothetical protein
LSNQPIDLLLFCPRCEEQHVDEAKPDVCELCGGEKDDFPRNEGANICACGNFTAWLNPPHKSHRCTACNHVWRPADVATNGVAATKTKGERDGSPIPTHKAIVDAFTPLINWLGWLRDKDCQIGNLNMTLVDTARNALAKATNPQAEGEEVRENG